MNLAHENKLKTVIIGWLRAGVPLANWGRLSQRAVITLKRFAYLVVYCEMNKLIKRRTLLLLHLTLRATSRKSSTFKDTTKIMRANVQCCRQHYSYVNPYLIPPQCIQQILTKIKINTFLRVRFGRYQWILQKFSSPICNCDEILTKKTQLHDWLTFTFIRRIAFEKINPMDDLKSSTERHTFQVYMILL